MLDKATEAVPSYFGPREKQGTIRQKQLEQPGLDSTADSRRGRGLMALQIEDTFP
jgi:hypothetical protein